MHDNIQVNTEQNLIIRVGLFSRIYTCNIYNICRFPFPHRLSMTVFLFFFYKLFPLKLPIKYMLFSTGIQFLQNFFFNFIFIAQKLNFKIFYFEYYTSYNCIAFNFVQINCSSNITTCLLICSQKNIIISMKMYMYYFVIIMHLSCGF